MRVSMALDERLRRVVAAVLGVAPHGLTDADSPDSLASWDSVVHIQLVMAIEAEFEIELSPEEIGDLTTIGAIRERLESTAGAP